MRAPRSVNQVDLFADLGHIPAVRPPIVRAFLGEDVVYAINGNSHTVHVHFEPSFYVYKRKPKTP